MMPSLRPHSPHAREHIRCDWVYPYVPSTELVEPGELPSILAVLKEHYRLTARDPPLRLCKGRSRKNYLITVAGARFVLQKMEGRDVGNVRAEGELLIRWRSGGNAIVAPQPVFMHGTNDVIASDERACYLLCHFLEGYGAKPKGDAAVPTPLCAYAIGRAVSQIAAQLSTLVPPLTALPCDPLEQLELSLRRLTRDARLHGEDKWGMLPRWLSPDLAIGRCRRVLSALDAQRNDVALIHGDIRFSNLIFGRHGDVVGVLDFEAVGYAPRALEHARALRNVLALESDDAATAGCIANEAVRSYFEGVASVVGSQEAQRQRRSTLEIVELAGWEELEYLLSGYLAGTSPTESVRQRYKVLLRTVSGFLQRATNGDLLEGA